MSLEQQGVLIAGGGPVGLLCAWLLARRGIAVRLFDENQSPQADMRAATTHPATLELLHEDGLAEDMARVGLVAPIFQFWDRPTGELVAEFDHAVLAADTRYPYVVQCEQFKTARLLLERLRAFPNAEIMFGRAAVDLRQSEGGVELDVRGPQGVATHAGAYLIGADGGRSTVRKQCGIAFEGFTWPERFVVLTTPYDFEAGRGYCYRSYFADPGAWCNCFKVSADGPPGLWRTVFPTEPGETDEDILSDAGVQARLNRFFPAPHPYPVVHRNLYHVHQRVAATFNKGRVFLAGDAAHINNPIGGLGLNCGIHDAVELAQLLTAVLQGHRPPDALAAYDQRRRPINIEYVQQQTVTNKKRLEEKDPVKREANFAFLRKTAADPQAHRAFLLRTSLIASLRKQDVPTSAPAVDRNHGAAGDAVFG